MSDQDQLKVFHDRLLAFKPASAMHDSGSCPLCAMDADLTSDSQAGGSMPETFTQEELDAAVAAASGPLQKRLSELEAQVQETEVGRAVAEAVAAKDTEISDLQSQLDAAEAARTAAQNQLAETERFWTEALAEHERTAAFAARRDHRITEAKAAGVFSEEYINDNADRFAAMSDEDFAARLSEWQLIAAARQDKPAGGIPAKTALVAARSEEAPTNRSALTYITDFRRERIDPRTLAGGA